VIDPKGRLHTGFSVDREHWICSGVLQSAGASIQWWSDVLGIGVEEMVGEVELDDPPGVFFAPYLAGERTPHLDPRVRAGFVSLEGATGRADMTRAVLEGVAFAFRDAAEIFGELDVHSSGVSITGGAVRNDTLCRIMANVLGKPLQRIGADVTAMGAAMLAACATDRFSAWKDAIEAWPVSGEMFEPVDHGLYDMAYRKFCNLYPHLASWSNQEKQE